MDEWPVLAPEQAAHMMLHHNPKTRGVCKVNGKIERRTGIVKRSNPIIYSFSRCVYVWCVCEL